MSQIKMSTKKPDSRWTVFFLFNTFSFLLILLAFLNSLYEMVDSGAIQSSQSGQKTRGVLGKCALLHSTNIHCKQIFYKRIFKVYFSVMYLTHNIISSLSSLFLKEHFESVFSKPIFKFVF